MERLYKLGYHDHTKPPAPFRLPASSVEVYLNIKAMKIRNVVVQRGADLVKHREF
jgi:hypothetical protein